ncbi:hypothetical protein [Aureimonas glaciei]|uniref:Uncharacterized protein n=1 Tax=Aureimonas glaciei TaxID=1776957 RepID=A0A916Y635_9HYPH|nr:hypothetical protein [Aureimonas glaciei]GGD30801.1 hypothetical protein GCM10011335_37280 [Aureimonas glaciei]
MPQAKFTKDFDYRVKPNSASGSIVAYKKGMSLSIPQAHLDAATEAGAIESAPAKAAAKEPANADLSRPAS